MLLMANLFTLRGGVDGGSPCHMSIIRNGHVTLSILRKCCVSCRLGLKRAVSPCRF